MSKSSRKQTTHIGGSKYFKRIISGKLQGTLDMASRYFLIKVPVGISDAYMEFRGMDGIHLLKLSAFDCFGYEVGWGGVGYHIDCEDYLIEKEFQRIKRRCPSPTECPLSCVQGYTDFYNPAHPSHLVGGRVPLCPRSISPSERWVHLPSYAAIHIALGTNMYSDRCINRWYVSPTHGSPPPHCSFLSAPSSSPVRCCNSFVSFSEPLHATIPPGSASPVLESSDHSTCCYPP